MITPHIAQGLADLGRRGDSTLVHMQPREVAGLQALAKAHGGSLTTNPDTGLPEASFLGDVLGTVAPIAAGFALGPAGFGVFNSALTAGLAVGAGAYALTGDPMKGLSAGLGAGGGFGLGENLAAFGKVAGPESIANVSEIAGQGANSAALGMAKDALGTSGLSNSSTLLDVAANAGSASNIPSMGSIASQTVPQSGIQNAISGVGKMFGSGPGEGFGAYKDFLSEGYTNAAGKLVKPSAWQDAATLGMPLLSLASRPQEYEIPEDTSYQMNYEGPYTYPDRDRRMPTEAEQQALTDAGSPEFSYFGNVNPYPGFVKAGYAEGGTIQTGGIRDLYSSPDDQLNGAVLSQDGYGLGRLQQLANGGQAYADGGPIAFGNGGIAPVPYVRDPAVAASYAVAPTNLNDVAAISNSGQYQPSVQEQLANATSDPLGRVNNQGMGGMGGMAGKGMGAQQNRPQYYGNPSMGQSNMVGINSMGGMGGKGMGGMSMAKPATPSMQDYIAAATRTRTPTAMPSPTGVEQRYFTQVNPQAPVKKAKGGELEQGAFIIPADVVSHLGNGSSNAGLAVLGKRYGAKPIRGNGDGMSDSIPTSIEGRQEARVADGEAYIPRDMVKRAGGAAKFHKMMNNVRKARTGTKKQGKQINPNKYLTA